jgi:hypothetical protein
MTVTITNLPAAAVVEHSLVRLVGTCAPSAKKITVDVDGARSTAGGDDGLCASVCAGKFIALVHLREHGSATVTVSDDVGGAAGAATITLEYVPEPPEGAVPRFELYYVLPREGEAEFENFIGPKPGPVAEAILRMRTFALLFQAFCFDDLACGRTMLFGMSAPGVPRVNIIRLDMPTAAFFALGDNWADGGGAGYGAILGRVRPHLDSAFAGQHVIPVAIPSMTRFNAKTKKLSGHTALGSPALAVFSSATLHAWPRSVADVVRAFTDTRPMPDSLPDDSCFRKSLWANASTCMGALVHECGHALTLPHTKTGIMMRGFDNVNRFFCADLQCEQLPPNHGSGVGGCFWDVHSKHVLKASPFLHFPGVRPEVTGSERAPPPPQAWADPDAAAKGPSLVATWSQV